MLTIDVSGALHPFSGQSLEYLPHNIPSTAEAADDSKYYGYLAFTGSWIIQKITESTGAIVYCKGKDDYATNWTNKASLTYNYFNLLF
jgi:hypothetical protein